MLTRLEKEMARHIINETDDPQLAKVVILLRKVFPDLELRGVPIHHYAVAVSHSVEKLDRELNPSKYETPNA
jgi:hypothetical protein